MKKSMKSIFSLNMIFNIFKSSLIFFPLPISISMWWNFGFLLGVFLMIQIVSGLFLAMHYCPNINMAFFSVVHIIQDVNYGWLIRNIHMNGASFYFICMYIHIFRGVYYMSYYLKKTWIMGVFILLFSMATAFLGYVLPWGQMSFWGATVITNLLTAIPYIGMYLVEWLWGGFSIGDMTLNRFFVFHFVMPFVLMGMVLLHLVFLHSTGSSNPLGVKSDYYKISFHPYFTYKDLMWLLVMMSFFLFMIFNYPYFFSDCDNFIMANSMITPIHIKPEWYFLFAYAILRSIPNKLGGVIALVMSIMILMILSFMKGNKMNSLKFYPLNQILYWLFLNTCIILTWLGGEPIEWPYDFLGKIFSVMYFSYFFINYYTFKLWDYLLH
uniref:Cytochrome b n=1 Tax=Megalyra sp. MM-2014 TaxID=1503221 RepID=A0A096XL94_9HYME|nr:cytochrome b [Megalyra sp. MM-2014]